MNNKDNKENKDNIVLFCTGAITGAILVFLLYLLIAYGSKTILPKENEYEVKYGRVTSETTIETDDGHVCGYDTDYAENTNVIIVFKIADKTNLEKYEPIIVKPILEREMNARVFNIESEFDLDNLYKNLESETRLGTVIIEVSRGTVLDNEGNGNDEFGYYRKYDAEKFPPGTLVESVFVYDPTSTAPDSILFRVDTEITR